MINSIVIIEDERLNADRLKRLIKTLMPGISVTAVLESVAQSVEWLQANPQPDLLLLDIRLSDGLSFDIFSKIAVQCPVIFTTAYDEYAVQAFKHNGIDYLLKPIEIDELQSSLNKVAHTAPKIYDAALLDNLLQVIKPKEYRSRFLLPFKDGFKAILVKDLKYIAVELGITKAYLTDGSELVLQQNMEELEQQLNPKQFFRANRQFIINIEAVVQILNYFNGKLKVLLKNSTVEIIISRDKSAALKSWMDF